MGVNFKLVPMSDPTKINKITADLLRPIRMNNAFKLWMTVLMVALVICLYAYYLQLKNGLGVAGILWALRFELGLTLGFQAARPKSEKRR